MNILIVKLSAIGDVIHTLPALSALRRAFPKAHISWLVEGMAADLLEGHPALDRVIISQRKKWLPRLKAPHRWETVREIVGFFQVLRDRRYDLVLDFQAALKGAVLIAAVRGKQKVGFGAGIDHSEYSYLVLNRRIAPVSMEVHALQRYLRLVEAIGVPPGPVAYGLRFSPSQKREMAQRLQQAGAFGRLPLIAINPMAQWPTKLWTTEKFAALADRLVETRRATVVWTGSPNDRPAIDDIRRRMRADSINMAGKTRLRELAVLLHMADLAISTDTGPMHLAAAVQTHVVALFGPTAPWRTGPYGSCHRIVRSPCACAPCYQRTCSHCRCMRAIEVEKVLDTVNAVLSKTERCDPK